MKIRMFEEESYFPQCHASCLLALEDGRKLCTYFAGKHEKADDVGIWLSEWDGKKWLSPRRIAKVQEDEPHWNPVLFRVKDGIRIVFKVGKEIKSWRSYTMLSRDGGRTWEALHAYCGNPAGGPVRSKPIRLESGALLAPNSDEDGSWLPRVDISWDEGESFSFHARIPINISDDTRKDYLTGKGASQPTLWESAPGKVHALLRSSAGRIFRSDSQDGGNTWTQAYPLQIPNNNSGIDILKAPDGTLYLAFNPVSGDFAARTPLCIAESRDNGAHFTSLFTVEDTLLDEKTGAGAEFSYPSLAMDGEKLCISYTFNRRCIAYADFDVKG